MKKMTQEGSSVGQFLLWLFTIFGTPITIPWLIYQLFGSIIFKHRKASLQGKVVLITGASSGLGEALAHAFYSCGCKLILVSRREKELQRVKNELIETYKVIPMHVPIILPLDLSKLDALSDEITKVLRIHERIDILINNAGISYRGEVINTKVDVDMKVMLINYFAPVALTKIVLPWMIKQNNGCIVSIGSIQGKIAIPNRSAYTASKHALQAWCDSARAELAKKNVKILVVSPGYIKTALSLNALTGSGQFYGKMDETTNKGYPPHYVAEEVLKAVLRNDSEITIGTISQKCAIYLRTLFPSLYFLIMRKRAKEM